MNENSNTGSTLSSSSTPSAEDISRRAYEIWEAEGRPEGADLRHWLQAQEELNSRAAATSASSGNSGGNTVPHSNGTTSHRNGGIEPQAPATSAPSTAPMAATAPREGKRGSASPFARSKSAPPASSFGKRK